LIDGNENKSISLIFWIECSICDTFAFIFLAYCS